MKLEKVNELISGTILQDCHSSCDYTKAFASDLMSDVLRFMMEDTVLITGLCTIQAIRTAEMSNISCIVFARDKRVTEDMLKLAKEKHIAVIVTKSTMFEVSGKLYQGGLEPVY
ncbi:MAG: DRTGG domain-containing protein [Dysgonamonadaceae bacterium]|nr:DRTGG domain-containing protein [Dysgonamonadaceae bacterium]